ncbi:alpha/beta fold hydrolase [Heyndrickxia sporothermodurans]
MFTRKTSVIPDAPNGISSLESVTLGDVKQWILLRGKDKNKPIVLCVHGGPGAAQIGFISHYTAELEKNFLIVNWDQRGSGLSFSNKITKEIMTIDQMVNDLIELARILCKRFHKKKIYILGHSWGSVLSYIAVQRYPELFYGYISVSQLVNWQQTEKVSYELTLQKAKEFKHRKAYMQLFQIGAPPWGKSNAERIYNKWLQVFGGGVIHKGSFLKLFIRPILKRSEYHFFDLIKWLRGKVFSMSALNKELETIDLYQTDLKLKVPIAFCFGRHDDTCPSHLAESFYNKLQAPQKKWIWFENSAHTPIIEESEFFYQFLVETVNEWSMNK